MKVTIANGWGDYGPGEIADLPEGVARDLLVRGKARPAPESPAKTKAHKGANSEPEEATK